MKAWTATLITLLVLTLLAAATPAQAQTRIKDITRLDGEV